MLKDDFHVIHVRKLFIEATFESKVRETFNIIQTPGKYRKDLENHMEF